MPVVRLPPNVNAPDVNIYDPVAVNEYAWFNVTFPAVCLNVATALNTAGLLYVNEPEVKTKLTEGVIVPLEKVNEGPLIVKVVQVIVPMFDSVPLLNVAVLEQVRLNVAKFKVPSVCV